MKMPLADKPCVLVVDDEVAIRELLTRVLGQEGFSVVAASNGRQGLRVAASGRPELIVLDLNLPDMHGEEVCRRLRQNASTEGVPVLILTGKTLEGLPARCLDGGADDYLAKPFDVDEISARIRALLRRTRKTISSGDVIAAGDLTIRVEERMVLYKDVLVPPFSPKEFELLRHLVTHAPKVLTKETLAKNVWGVPFNQLHQRTMDVHFRRIRKKLGPAAASCLRTIPAIGYQWRVEMPVHSVVPLP